MKFAWYSLLAAVLTFGATPALSDEAWHVFECQLHDEEGDVAEDDVIAAAEKWLAAAQKVPGGENMELKILLPHAAASGDTDFVLVLYAPSFAAWGTFWDNYEGSEAHAIDEESDELTACPNSRLFEVVSIEAS